MESDRPLALITGGRRGIGAAIAIELAANGFNIAITDVEAAGSSETLNAISAHGAKVKLFISDLAKVEHHEELINSVVVWGGPISVLVNNAGIGSPNRGDLLDIHHESFDLVMNINLRGTFFLTQAVARHMSKIESKRSRTIITVSSVSAEMVSSDRGEYCISKSALGMLTKLFAVRLAPLGIGVFEIRPGIIHTPMTEAVSVKYDQRIAEGLVPMNRWGFPNDIAHVVQTLATGNMVFSTGSTLNIDGALSISRL